MLETWASTKPLLSVGEGLRLFPGTARPQPRGARAIHGPLQGPQHRGRAAHGVRLLWGCFHVSCTGLDSTVPTTALLSTDRRHTVGSIICHFHQVPALYSYTFRNVNHLYKTVRAVTSPAAWEKKSKHSLWRALSNRVSYSRCGEWGVLPVRHAGGVDSGVLGGQLPEF